MPNKTHFYNAEDRKAAIRQRLDALGALTPGWDSYHADPITADAVEAVWNLLMGEMPGIYPNNDGGLEVEWSTRESNISLECNRHGVWTGVTFEHKCASGDE